MTADITPENVARVIGAPDYAEGDCESVKDAMLAALAARLAEVEAEQHKWWKHCRAAEKRANAAEAENAKLRDALRDIAETSNYTRSEWMQDKARAALQVKP